MSGTFFSCGASCDDIRAGDFAALCDYTSIQYCMDRDFSLSGQCNTYSPNEPVLFPSLWALALSKDFPYRDTFNLWILRLTASQIYEKAIQDLISNSTYCTSFPSKKDRQAFSPLSLDHFRGIFFMLFVGKSLFS